MKTIKYTIIKSKSQYDQYCNALEDLIFQDNKELDDEIELLTLLIEKWDAENSSLQDSDPVELLKGLMAENNLKAKDLVDILNLSKGSISKILNYHKGLSKKTIRRLSVYFKLSQEAFNRPYKLKNQVRQFPNERLMNTLNKLSEASS